MSVCPHSRAGQGQGSPSRLDTGKGAGRHSQHEQLDIVISSHTACPWVQWMCEALLWANIWSNCFGQWPHR